MAPIPPELQAHREWLGLIQQVGLVLSPQVLVNSGVFVDRQVGIDTQARLRDLLGDEDEAHIDDFAAFARDILEWPEGLLVGPALPDTLTVALPEYEDTLSPAYAVPNGDKPGEWLALVSVVPPGTDPDKAPGEHAGWRASPHARVERLLRETSVPIGLLFTGASLRLVYAPRGESSGHLTFRFAHLVQTLGRPMVGALRALLGADRVTGGGFEQQSLPYLLQQSRKYQNEVSTALAGQVLEALWELLRGLQRANEESKGTLLAEVLSEEPREVYGGLLTTLMRLVFILYAEDRGLMPDSDVYQGHYSVSGLFKRLREDQARYPDTMDARYGAWAQLLVLFRLVHDGGGHGDLRFPSRHGRLFDPDAYPFLEGRPHGSRRQAREPVDPPQIANGVVYRVLRNLLILEGERLSYRALDVEQIGSVYEAMMGFALQAATGSSIAVTPKHIVVNVEELVEQKPKDRTSWLKEQTELKLTSDALAKATTVDEAVAALGKKVSRYTPRLLKPGDLFLQPTEERRRSGSHYTPRSLTEPIVRTTFRPILERLGDQATPEQILALKVCDPAMGSGAFLVEACRLLGERLVRAWEVHKATPKFPDDEDALMFARRLVAERCLYGVDKNIFAVDLAKLSLWLATLARDHPFTFLDHALRHGDSLVGLSREQIACLHWTPTKQLPLIRTFIDARVAEAQKLRLEIQSMGASDDVGEKSRLLKEADEALADVRLIGDVVVSAFFAREKPKDRETLRVVHSGDVQRWLDERERRDGVGRLLALRAAQDSVRGGDRPVPAFHWEIEYPEVFTCENGGFDVFVGNPPFAGKNTIAAATRENYLPWLLTAHADSHGNADLVAHFYRRAFNLLRRDGTFGLIATNTIAQGDTRGTGLRFIRQHGGSIFAAHKRIVWPGTAAVVVSVVHVCRGDSRPPLELNGRRVDRITAFLFHRGRDSEPLGLRANLGLAFKGVSPNGLGFVFSDVDEGAIPLSRVTELLQEPRNRQVIRPYIGGEEILTVPDLKPTRWIIDLDGMSLEQACQWPELLAELRQRVRPERAAKGGAMATLPWWHYERSRPEMRKAISNFQQVLTTCHTAGHLCFAYQPTERVFSQTVIVIANESAGAFAVLQSRVHELWARFFGSTLEERPRYTPSDCFETFPFPGSQDRFGTLEAIGRRYYEFRGVLMLRAKHGLTSTYNRFHDQDERSPDILSLRELHDAVDRAVLDAYGWTDIRPTCDFILEYQEDEDERPGKSSKRRKPWRYRWPDDVRDEVLGRLLALNAERAAEEALAGKEARAAEATKGRSTAKGSRSRKGQAGGTTPLLD